MEKYNCSWDEDTGVAIYTIFYDDETFTGHAICHTDDKDMQSERVGTAIAQSRAMIKLYQFIRDHEIKPQLKALKQLYYSMNRSKEFNPKSYENYMLYRQVRLLENDLVAVKEMLAITRRELKDYIEAKDKMYKLIRAKREGQTQSIISEQISE